jgi:hypothetical protein
VYINLVNENDVTNIQYNALPEYFITPTEYSVVFKYWFHQK